MDRVEEIVARLRLDANALGAWLLGPLRGPLPGGTQEPSAVLASSVLDDSIAPPRSVHAEGEAYVDRGDTKLYVLPIDSATLVVVFDERSSLGLVRLRAHKAKADIQRARTSI